MRRLCAGLLLALACLCGVPASAYTCNATITDVNFGTVWLRSGTTNRTTADVTVTCEAAAPLVPIGTCVDIGPGSGGADWDLAPRYLQRVDGARSISYDLRYGGYGLLTSGTWTSQMIWITPGADGRGSATLTLHADIPATTTAGLSGFYRSTFSGSSGATLTYGIALCGLLGARVAIPSFTVTANVQPSCSAGSATLSFGQINPAFSAPIDASAVLQVQCSVGVPYSIRLEQGSRDPADRIMTGPQGQLRYGLYRDSGRSQPWGSLVSNDQDAVGTGGQQGFPVYGRIFGNQIAKAGTYQDSVVVTINY